MTKKISLYLTSLLIIASLLVSCGNKTKETNGETDTVDKNDGIGETAGTENEDEGKKPDADLTDPDTSGTENNENAAPDDENNEALPEDEENVTPPNENEGGDEIVPEDTESEDPEPEAPEADAPTPPPVGTNIGNLAPTMTLTTVDGGTVSSADFLGKVVVINVWGTWCPPCRNELPDFDRIATEYDGEVVILAVHSNSGKSNAPSFINANFPDSKIVFAYDTPEESYHSLIGGTVYYPRTVILDKEGVITYADDGAISYSYLKQLVTEAGEEK